MLCPKCGNKDSKVVDSRSADDSASIRRRRECLECGFRFTTYERCEEVPLLVKKKDGGVQAFDSKKLIRSLMICTAKRNIPYEKLDSLVRNVEMTLRERYGGEVLSTELGDEVLIELEKLDKVAYVRFASVYKDFKDLSEFNSELQRLSKDS